MQNSENTEQSLAEPNYDEPPVAELSIGDTAYRVDVGFRSAIAISTRLEGTWTWRPIAEGRWDGLRMKCKALPHDVVSALERALRESARASDS